MHHVGVLAHFRNDSRQFLLIKPQMSHLEPVFDPSPSPILLKPRDPVLFWRSGGLEDVLEL